MKAIYDKIGIDYAQKRQSDPRIASQILEKLKGAKRIVNIGAGTGSYEPKHMDLIAIEPSQEMIKQRPENAHKVIQGSAESLPLPDQSFSHALTILSMHHWKNRELAFKEINRVATDKFVAVSWNPESKPFWLTRDYFPEMIEVDRQIFPSVRELETNFDNVEVCPLLIPEDCIDGFLAAYWKRPSAYLNKAVRQSISSFSKLDNINTGLEKLEFDLETGSWHKTNRSILNKTTLDTGYIIISAKTKYNS